MNMSSKDERNTLDELDEHFVIERPVWLSAIRGLGGTMLISKELARTIEDATKIALFYWKRVFKGITAEDISVYEPYVLTAKKKV